jgi:hypothetical protein
MDFYWKNASIHTAPYIQSTVTYVHHVSPCSALSLLWQIKWKLITIFIFLDIIHNLFFHPLRKIPGPFLARATVLWRLVRYFRGSWHDDVVKVHRQYGQVVRITPGEVSFTDEVSIKSIYGHGKRVEKVTTVSTLSNC